MGEEVLSVQKSYQYLIGNSWYVNFSCPNYHQVL